MDFTYIYIYVCMIDIFLLSCVRTEREKRYDFLFQMRVELELWQSCSNPCWLWCVCWSTAVPSSWSGIRELGNLHS